MEPLQQRALGARRAWRAGLVVGLLAATVAAISVLGFAEGQDGPTGPGATPPPPVVLEGVVPQGPLGDPTNLTGASGPGPGEVHLTWSPPLTLTPIGFTWSKRANPAEDIGRNPLPATPGAVPNRKSGVHGLRVGTELLVRGSGGAGPG